MPEKREYSIEPSFSPHFGYCHIYFCTSWASSSWVSVDSEFPVKELNKKHRTMECPRKWSRLMERHQEGWSLVTRGSEDWENKQPFNALRQEILRNFSTNIRALTAQMSELEKVCKIKGLVVFLFKRVLKVQHFEAKVGLAGRKIRGALYHTVIRRNSSQQIEGSRRTRISCQRLVATQHNSVLALWSRCLLLCRV